MTEVTDENQISDQSDSREPYEPPKLEVEELFESLALACGKINPLIPVCGFVQRNS